MGWFRKITGQQGEINRQKAALAEQERSARESADKQTQALQESARQAAMQVQQAQERAAAQAAAQDLLSKPLAEAEVTVGAGEEAATTRKKKLNAYSTGVNI